MLANSWILYVHNKYEINVGVWLNEFALNVSLLLYKLEDEDYECILGSRTLITAMIVFLRSLHENDFSESKQSSIFYGIMPSGFPG